MGCLSYGGCALPGLRTLIPLLIKEGLGEVAAFVGWVKRIIPKTDIRQNPLRFLYRVARKTLGV